MTHTLLFYKLLTYISIYNEITFFFVFALKSVPLEIIWWFFSIGPANFSASDRRRVDFPSVWESPEKNKNLKLIKMAQKRNRAKRKCHTCFFVFHLLKMKLVPIDSGLKFAPGNQTHFFKKVGVVPRKAAKFEKVVWNSKNTTFVTYSR